MRFREIQTARLTSPESCWAGSTWYRPPLLPRRLAHTASRTGSHPVVRSRVAEAPTQQLGAALEHSPSIEGFLTPSARAPAVSNLVVLPHRRRSKDACGLRPRRGVSPPRFGGGPGCACRKLLLWRSRSLGCLSRQKTTRFELGSGADSATVVGRPWHLAHWPLAWRDFSSVR